MANQNVLLDPNVTVPLVLRFSVLKQLTAQAEARGVSRSALVRNAVLELVADNPLPSKEAQQ